MTGALEGLMLILFKFITNHKIIILCFILGIGFSYELRAIIQLFGLLSMKFDYSGSNFLNYYVQI